LDKRRVVVTGMGGLSPVGNDWPTVRENLAARRNGVRVMPEWDQYQGLNTRLGAPVAPYTLSPRFTRKETRSMGNVALYATLASEKALEDAGLLGRDIVTNGMTGVAYGSSTGTPASIREFGRMLIDKTLDGINANTYIKMMPHTTTSNIGIFFGITGRIIPSSTACTSGSIAIGYAYETIKYGKQIVMLAGGAEELCATEAAVFDVAFATETDNGRPEACPKPFDVARKGLVVGEGAATLVLEEREHALARGARIYAEIIGFGVNSDGRHVTQPRPETMARAMALALEDARIAASDVDYVNGHGTATVAGDIAESQATFATFGGKTPFSALKGYTGHTLAAAGAIEAWITLHMMQEGRFAPNLNLETLDERCAPLNYLHGGMTELPANIVASNNFAFGGVNTALIFSRP
jgi:3-oxoacyl-[acyl-carrier-protein] synthase II